MSDKSWLRFLLRLIDLVLEVVKDYLLNGNGEEQEKRSAVGD